MKRKKSVGNKSGSERFFGAEIRSNGKKKGERGGRMEGRMGFPNVGAGRGNETGGEIIRASLATA